AARRAGFSRARVEGSPPAAVITRAVVAGTPTRERAPRAAAGPAARRRSSPVTFLELLARSTPARVIAPKLGTASRRHRHRLLSIGAQISARHGALAVPG